MSTELASTRTLLTQIVGGIHDAEGQKRIADKLNNTLEQLVSLANTKHASQYLFGGNNTSAAPYAVVREGGRIVEVDLPGERRGAVRGRGGRAGHRVATTSGTRSSAPTTARRPVFLGDSGAAAGTGTSNVEGDVWLTVDHDGTQLPHLDRRRGHVRDGARRRERQPGRDGLPHGPGPVRRYDRESTRPASSWSACPGTYDVFNTLISLRDLLMNERGLNHAGTARLRGRVRRGGGGGPPSSWSRPTSPPARRSASSTPSSGNLEDMEFDTKDETTRLQEADVAQIAIDLSRREVLYQMSLSVAGKLMTMSLLDFIAVAPGLRF